MLLLLTIGFFFVSLLAFGIVYGGIQKVDKKSANIGLLFPFAMLYYGAKYYSSVKASYVAWIVFTLLGIIAGLLYLTQQ